MPLQDCRGLERGEAGRVAGVLGEAQEELWIGVGCGEAACRAVGAGGAAGGGGGVGANEGDLERSGQAQTRGRSHGQRWRRRPRSGGTQAEA
jgi:hypothetical protein